jgi:CheY-like chemotaxis protein
VKHASKERKASPPLSAYASSPAELRAKIGTVLVVDDSAIARTLMVNVLAEAGLKVQELESPIGATRAILSHDVSVVVVDLMMPGLRGDRLAKLFRENPRFKRVGLVLVSGESEQELERLVAEAGADAAVSKSNLQFLLPAVIRARRARMNGSD